MTNLVQFPGLGLSFTINRVAFSIGDFAIYWYGILIGTGMLLAMLYAFRMAPRLGINVDRMIDVIFIGAVMAVICARAYYVVFAPFKYTSFAQMLDIRDGGLAIYGGVLGAFVFGGLASKWRKVPILPMFDITAIGFLIGQCLGRWGNFVNQEAFGTNTTMPWGMISPQTTAYLTSVQQTLAAQGVQVDPQMPVHPTFLYESIWCLVGFIGLALYLKHRHFNGEIALLYVFWYGTGRAWIEGLRTDSLYVTGSLRMSQLLAVISALAALITWLYLRWVIYRKTPALGWVPAIAAEVPAGKAGQGAEHPAETAQELPKAKSEQQPDTAPQPAGEETPQQAQGGAKEGEPHAEN